MAKFLTVPKTRLDLAKILKSNDYNINETISDLGSLLDLDESKKDCLHATLRRIRDTARKAKKSLDSLDGAWWNSQIFLEPQPTKLSISLPDISETVEKSIRHRKNIDELSLKQQRLRLSSVLEAIELLSKIEYTSKVKIAALALQLLSNEENNRKVSQISKSIVHDNFNGNFGNLVKKELEVGKALFLIDLLEIGKRKYTQLRQHLLTSDIHFPAYHKVAEHRNAIVIRSAIQLYPNPTSPIGVSVPYAQYVQHTFSRILQTIASPPKEDFPLTFRIADGLDGSGSHTVYNQLSTNTETKCFILYCFKPIQITSCSGTLLWKNNSPNSPFYQRPIFLCAAKENEDNIRQFIENLINPETDSMQNHGFDLGDDEHVWIDIVRSMFDGKMAAIMSGAGGASCQLCTATQNELKDRDLVIQGFPINRHISDAIQLFEDLEGSNESFFMLPSNQRFNLTHEPISNINIVPASPLHAYTCIFRWFNLLIYHLNVGTLKWSPSSASIKSSMTFVRTLVQEKTGLRIDQPDPRGGTTSTGSVARRAFSDESGFMNCTSSLINTEYRAPLSLLHAQLSAVLRIINSDRRIDTKQLGILCTNTYLLILDSFPWASITPTLHKVLAHSEELIRDINSGYGLKSLSEEGSEACNKLIRKYRENLARKTCFEDNIVDIFVRLASESDPILVEYRSKLVCEICGEYGHTRRKCCKNVNIDILQSTIDSIVDKLIIK